MYFIKFFNVGDVEYPASTRLKANETHMCPIIGTSTNKQ